MSAAFEAAVVIVGTGPAGLAAARTLTARRVHPVLVVDRDDGPGGLPRYCQHLGFGWEYTGRLESGARFARHLLSDLDASGCRVVTRTTVLKIRPGPAVEMVGPETGLIELRPRAVILATGIRERPRAARLVPGGRPERGVLTTGQLQQMVTRGVPLSGKRAVVVGSEHVSFSALLTARHGGMRVAAMVEPGERILSFPIAGPIARVLFGVSIRLRTSVEDIFGREKVEGIVVRGPEGKETIACDSVVFTGDFVPDAPLVRASNIEIDPYTGGPVIDQMMRTSMSGVFAAGNLLRPVETSGVAALEGARAGACVAAYLRETLEMPGRHVPIGLGDGIRYLVPQRWSLDEREPEDAPILRPSLRVKTDQPKSRVVLSVGGVPVWTNRRKNLLRERRIAIDLSFLHDHGEIGTSVDVAISRTLAD